MGQCCRVGHYGAADNLNPECTGPLCSSVSPCEVTRDTDPTNMHVVFDASGGAARTEALSDKPERACEGCWSEAFRPPIDAIPRVRQCGSDGKERGRHCQMACQMITGGNRYQA
jgi:hypothetical protein